MRRLPLVLKLTRARELADSTKGRGFTTRGKAQQRSPMPTRGELVAVLGAGLAALLVTVVVASGIENWSQLLRQVREQRDLASVEVPMLTREVQPGQVIDRDSVAMVAFPVALLDPGAVLKREELVGRTVIERALAGEPVRSERLAPPRAAPGLEALVPYGMRALQLDLGDDDRVSGFVEPGDRVDLIVTLPGDGDRPSETITLAEAVALLTVDERLLHTHDGLPVHRPRIAIAVRPELAEQIMAVPRIATSAKLALRADADFGTAAPAPATLPALPHSISISEYHQRVSAAELEAMEAMVDALHLDPVRVIDPVRIRDPRL